MSELKPCPFCGGDARLRGRKNRRLKGKIVWVECNYCGSMGEAFVIPEACVPKILKLDEKELAPIVEAWNRRV